MIFHLRVANPRVSLKTFSLFILITASLFGVGTAQAQDGEDIFRGTWQAKTTEQGTLILIAKRAGQASYFWASNTDNTVYKGEWLPNGDSATFNWKDGSSYKLQREALGFSIKSFDAHGQENFETRAQQVPQEILGQWAKPPAEPEDLTSDRDAAKGFFGIWEIENGSGSHYVIVEADRSAASTWSGSISEASGLRGSWAKQGSELHIAWESGHYSIVRENERGFSYKRIEPGTTIEDDSGDFTPASRTSKENLPSAWAASYDNAREKSAGGIAFSNRNAARKFYRGDWLIQIKEKGFEKVSLGRFGGLQTSLDRSLSGQWLMSGQDIFMRWDDGIRKILSPIGRGFVVYEYKPGRPLDGVPSRIYAATPADTSKFAAYLKGREQIADQMINLAAAAGVTPSTSDSGWGRTFMRWAWPFREGAEASSTTSAILTEAYVEESDSEDPWWWPFWSEKRLIAEKKTSATPEPEEEKTSGKLELAEEKPSTEESTTPAKQQTSKNSKKKEWYWPF